VRAEKSGDTSSLGPSPGSDTRNTPPLAAENLSVSKLSPLDKDTLEIGAQNAHTQEAKFIEAPPTEEDVKKRAQEAGLEDEDTTPLFDNLKYLYKKDREKFSCIYNSNTLITLFNLPFKKSALDRYSTSQIKLLESRAVLDEKDKETLKYYVASSDYFNVDGDTGIKLRQILSRFKTPEDTIVYRGDKGSGMFDKVGLKTPGLEEKIKQANEENLQKTSSVKFGGFGTTFSGFEEIDYLNDTQNIYTHIKEKDTLSLADAMLMMPYLDKGTRKLVLDELKGVKVVDDRFKSTTLKDDFAQYWIEERPEVASIFSEITLEKGMEGVYVFGKNWMGGQCEFILNNNPKETVVEEAYYNEKENRFYLKTRMRML